MRKEVETCGFDYADLWVVLHHWADGWTLVIYNEDGEEIHTEEMTRDFGREAAIDWAIYRCRNIAQFEWITLT
jgi:hypothetical protein